MSEHNPRKPQVCSRLDLPQMTSQFFTAWVTS